MDPTPLAPPTPHGQTREALLAAAEAYEQLAVEFRRAAALVEALNGPLGAMPLAPSRILGFPVRLAPTMPPDTIAVESGDRAELLRFGPPPGATMVEDDPAPRLPRARRERTAPAEDPPPRPPRRGAGPGTKPRVKALIVPLLLAGKGTKEIARKIGCSPSTVAYHAKLLRGQGKLGGSRKS